MLCDSCGERDAVVQLTRIEGGEVKLLHLCERCAAENGVETIVPTPKHPLAHFLEAVQQQAALTSVDSRCVFCHTTMADFRATGRWGCARSVRATRAPGAWQREAYRQGLPTTAERDDRAGCSAGRVARAAAPRDRKRAVRACR